MTMAPPQDIFEQAMARPLHTVRRERPPGRGRLVAMAITILIHFAVVAALVAGAEVAHPAKPRSLTVDLAPAKHEPPPRILPPPLPLAHPPTITAPMPEVILQAVPPSPIFAAPPKPVVQPPAPASMGARSEGRDTYLGRLLAQLNRFKRYPPEARRAHIEGVVIVHFVMDASGALISFEIAKSSGHSILDAEALALMRRVQPLPALPAGFPTRMLDAEVPIEFALNP